MPERARLWVYQANRALSNEEKRFIQAQTAAFVKQWTAHGADLKASFEIFFDQFLVISVDENFNQASGCSIDSSVKFVQFLENELKISLLDRTQIAFSNPGTEVFTRPFTGVKSSIEAGEIGEDTLVFNNAVSSKGEFDRNWKIPSKNSWLNKYF